MIHELTHSVTRAARSILPERLSRPLFNARARSRINHVDGLKRIHLKDNEAAVTCVVKNGDFYIADFIRHYTRLGFRHIFLLDNGSTDETISRAKQFSNVTIYETTLPIGSYQRVMKEVLARTVITGGWCLDVDIDEFFDYPHSHELELPRFFEYLNTKNYTCVMTQMLDMFSDDTISTLANNTRVESLKDTYRFYDLSSTYQVDYQTAELAQRFGNLNELGDPNAKLFFGGIRKDLFSLDCLLTKHSLFRMSRSSDLFTHVHFMNRTRIADVSCLLLHYKLVGNCYETSIENGNAFPSTRKGYEDLISLIETKPELRIRGDRAAEYRQASDLIDVGFLFASPGFLSFAENSLPKTDAIEARDAE